MTFIDRRTKEKILIVGIKQINQTKQDLDEDLDELTSLIDTAGAEVVGCLVQNHLKKDPRYLLTIGKANQLAVLCEKLDVDTVVFDESLSPAQQSNLEKLLGRTAIDREAVILDIFAQNAHSLEGKLQVELAILKYRAARLTGKGQYMSRLAGGIGTRGPGETQLETDKRRINARIHKLERMLKEVAKRREIQRKKREKKEIFEAVLVGYTNAGKSSLHKLLTKANSTVVDSKLFSTLDAKTTKLKKYYDLPIVVSDTVGFIKKLPHNLISAFNSTLAQVANADLIIHVVDGSTEKATERVKVVHEVLAQIGAAKIDEILVINKADLDPVAALSYSREFNADVVVSAKNKNGIDLLIDIIAKKYKEQRMLLANFG